MDEMVKRNKIIIRTSIDGVLANVLLGVFKIIFGLMASSPAVVSSAVGNFTDALASVVVLVGAFFSFKRPNKRHPFGYGRVEYLVILIIAIVVLDAGIGELSETYEIFKHGHETHYTVITLVVVIVSSIVKRAHGIHMRRRAHTVESTALHAVGSEAVHHGLLSIFTAAAVAVRMYTGYSLEAYATGIIGIVITAEGVKLLFEAIAKILGHSVPTGLRQEVRQTILHNFDQVQGVYDLTLHDYGPDRYMGSVHITVPEDMTAGELDWLERQIQKKVLIDQKVFLAGISIYSVNSHDPDIIRMRDDISSLVTSYSNMAGIHGFYVNKELRYASLDIVMSFNE